LHETERGSPRRDTGAVGIATLQCVKRARDIPLASFPLIFGDKFVRAAGIAIVTGLAVSSIFYYEGFFSVWCFFAALASVTIFGSFQSRNVSTTAIA
jgi:hypothetical protein